MSPYHNMKSNRIITLPELWCVCHQLKLANEPAKLWWQVCGRNHRWCWREGRTWKTSWKSKAWRDFEELLCRGVKGLGNGSKYCHILSGLTHTLNCLWTDPLFGLHHPHHFSYQLPKFPHQHPDMEDLEGWYPSYQSPLSPPERLHHKVHVMFWLDFIHHADTSDCYVYFFFLPYIEALYDMISQLLNGFPLYNTIWWSSWCTISILEPRILRYLVSGELQSPST